VRWFERQHLAAFIQPRFDLAERRAGFRGDHEFGRVIFDNPAMRPRIDYLALQRLPVPVFRAAAANP